MDGGYHPSIFLEVKVMETIGFKELYEVSLKTTYPIELGDKKLEIGETVAVFDKLQLSTFEEKRDFANTGKSNNGAQVWWEETKEVRLVLTQGVFSKTQLGLMMNAKYVEQAAPTSLQIHCREEIETDSNGFAEVKYPISQPAFVYEKSTGKKIQDVIMNNNALKVDKGYTEIIVDYYYNYQNPHSDLVIGRALTNGYLSLEGRMRVKDDTTGQIITGIIKIPKLKLLSDLSMRLGQNAVPLVGQLHAVALPTGERGHKKVMEIIFLDEDIDSDM
jgi:hypothetical protein